MTSTHTRPYGPKRHRPDQPDLRGLDALHRRLVTAACAGEEAEFESDDVLDTDVLTALITGRSYQGRAPWPVAPKGGRVNTRLDLQQAQIDWSLGLIDMDLPEGVDLSYARTRMLVFDDTRLKDLCLVEAIVQGQLGADGAVFNNADSEALNAQGAEIAAGLFLDNATLNGQCAINSAKIGGQLAAEKAQFNNPKGKALWAQGAEIASGLFLHNATLNGQCDIAGAKIGGQVSANKAVFNNPDDDAINAQGVEITDGVFFRIATLRGTCDFNGAQTGPIFLNGTTLIGQFKASFGARIKQLDLSQARLVSAWHHFIGPEFIGPTLYISTVLNLSDARIGRLDMPNKAGSLKGIVDLTRCHVGHFCDHKAAWPEPLEADGKSWRTPPSRLSPDTGFYRLNGFTYDYLASPNGGSEDGAEDSTAEARKRWLLSQHAHHVAEQFKPQPWRQMAARLDAQGHDEAARKIALYRRRYHRQSRSTRGPRIFVSFMLDILSHYGFNPWRTLGISAGVIAAFALIYGIFAWTGPMPDGGYSPLAGYTAPGPVSDANANPPPVFIRAQADDVTAATNVQDLAQADPFLARVYPDFNPLLYSLDVFVPVLDLGMDAYWRPNPNHLRPAGKDYNWMVGSILYWLTLVQRFVGAILIAIMVTSFTGLLTREDRLS